MDLNGKTLLITGGAGFIGSHFVRYVLNRYPEAKVVNFDALTYAGNLENLKAVESLSTYHFIQGDITDEPLVERIFSEFKPDVVFNFAAETHVDRSILGPKHFVLTDVLGTYTLLEAARRNVTPLYVQISTDEVYGSIPEGEFTETSPFQPNSPYSASKAGADHLVRAYHQTYGLPVLRTHSCNVFGPYQFPEKIIPLFATNLMGGKPVSVYGDGQQVREWIYAPDYCVALDTIVSQGTVGEVYNIGTGWRVPNLELTHHLLKHFGKDESFIRHVPDRLGHDVRYALSSEKLRGLGWQPAISFEAALTETLRWYEVNEAWWKPLQAKLA